MVRMVVDLTKAQQLSMFGHAGPVPSTALPMKRKQAVTVKEHIRHTAGGASVIVPEHQRVVMVAEVPPTATPAVRANPLPAPEPPAPATAKPFSPAEYYRPGPGADPEKSAAMRARMAEGAAKERARRAEEKAKAAATPPSRTVKLGPLMADELHMLEVDTWDPDDTTPARAEFVKAMQARKPDGTVELTPDALFYLRVDALDNSENIWEDQTEDGDPEVRSRAKRLLKQLPALLRTLKP